MRKVLTFALAALMVVAIAGASSAAAPNPLNWRFNFITDNGAGLFAASNFQLGVSPTSVDGPDTILPLQDLKASFGTDLPGTGHWTVSLVPGDTTNLYLHDLQSNASPYTYTEPRNTKLWNLRVAGNSSATGALHLSFTTTGLTQPSVDQDGKPVFYEMRMINNRGMAGAPTNGTIWNIPIPASGTASNVKFWDMAVNADTNGTVWGNMPLINVSVPNYASFRDEGYEMQFRMVPEPSSMLAMGSGLIGLIGVAIRRRRA